MPYKDFLFWDILIWLTWILFIACLRALLKPRVCGNHGKHSRGGNRRSWDRFKWQDWFLGLFVSPGRALPVAQWTMVRRHHSIGYLMSQCSGWPQLCKRVASFTVIQLSFNFKLRTRAQQFTLELITTVGWILYYNNLIYMSKIIFQNPDGTWCNLARKEEQCTRSQDAEPEFPTQGRKTRLRTPFASGHHQQSQKGKFVHDLNIKKKLVGFNSTYCS